MVFVRKLANFIFKAFVIFALLVSLLFWGLTTSGQVVSPTLSSDDVKISQQVLSTNLAKFQKAPGNIQLVFSQADFDAMSNVASHTLQPLVFQVALFDNSAVFNVVFSLPELFQPRLIHAYCFFAETSQGFAIDTCKIGRLPVSGRIANYLLKKSVLLLLDSPSDQQVLQLLKTAQVRERQLRFHSEQPESISLALNPSLFNSQSGVETLWNRDAVLADLDIEFYLQALKQLVLDHPAERRLAFYLQQLLKTALIRAESSDLETEYRNALWALVVAFGNKKFSAYLKEPIDTSLLSSFPRLTLAGRADLTLHFLYSAAFKSMSNTYFAGQIGFLKEINDAGRGGSGFSFVDQAANKAGVFLVQQLENINPRLLHEHTPAEFEQAFFPAITDLPEGITESQFKQEWGGASDPRYQAKEQLIEQRLANLVLYKKDAN